MHSRVLEPTQRVSAVIRHPSSIVAAPIGTSVLDLMGNTPLLSFKHIAEAVAPVRVFAKAEWYNPGGSVKDRAAMAMILDGERRGLLTKDKIILDATSGNTGIAYAMIAAERGYKVK